jgi:hypothetical protein
MIPLQESYSPQTPLTFHLLKIFFTFSREVPMKVALVLLLTVTAVGCGGYGSKSMTPPQPGTKPAITQLNPASTAAMGPSFLLTVEGANFNSNAVINFNGAAQTTSFDNAGQVRATIPASAIMSSGPVPVTVTNPGTPGGIYGGGTAAATSAPMTFNIQ